MSRKIIFLLQDTPPPEFYTLSLHDALPISGRRKARSRTTRRIPRRREQIPRAESRLGCNRGQARARRDRKSTRLNSSHVETSYAVFCLKKKKARNTPACLIIKTTKTAGRKW